jgi:hypothetical protein
MVIALGQEYHDERCLTLLFDTDEPEQVATLHSFRAAFGAATDIEAVNESVYALHIRPGHPGCMCGGEGWRQRP